MNKDQLQQQSNTSCSRQLNSFSGQLLNTSYQFPGKTQINQVQTKTILKENFQTFPHAVDNVNQNNSSSIFQQANINELSNLGSDLTHNSNESNLNLQHVTGSKLRAQDYDNKSNRFDQKDLLQSIGQSDQQKEQIGSILMTMDLQKRRQQEDLKQKLKNTNQAKDKSRILYQQRQKEILTSKDKEIIQRQINEYEASHEIEMLKIKQQQIETEKELILYQKLEIENQIEIFKRQQFEKQRKRENELKMNLEKERLREIERQRQKEKQWLDEITTIQENDKFRRQQLDYERKRREEEQKEQQYQQDQEYEREIQRELEKEKERIRERDMERQIQLMKDIEWRRERERDNIDREKEQLRQKQQIFQIIRQREREEINLKKQKLEEEQRIEREKELQRKIESERSENERINLLLKIEENKLKEKEMEFARQIEIVRIQNENKEIYRKEKEKQKKEVMKKRQRKELKDLQREAKQKNCMRKQTLSLLQMFDTNDNDQENEFDSLSSNQNILDQIEMTKNQLSFDNYNINGEYNNISENELEDANENDDKNSDLLKLWLLNPKLVQNAIKSQVKLENANKKIQNQILLNTSTRKTPNLSVIQEQSQFGRVQNSIPHSQAFKDNEQQQQKQQDYTQQYTNTTHLNSPQNNNSLLNQLNNSKQKDSSAIHSSLPQFTSNLQPMSFSSSSPSSQVPHSYQSNISNINSLPQKQMSLDHHKPVLIQTPKISQAEAKASALEAHQSTANVSQLSNELHLNLKKQETS